MRNFTGFSVDNGSGGGRCHTFWQVLESADLWGS